MLEELEALSKSNPTAFAPISKKEAAFRTWLKNEGGDPEAAMAAVEKRDVTAFYNAAGTRLTMKQKLRAYAKALGYVQTREGTEWHHIMTNKNSISTAEGGALHTKI